MQQAPRDVVALFLSKTAVSWVSPPEMSRTSYCNGRFPLHLVCSQGKSWFGGIQALSLLVYKLLNLITWIYCPFNVLVSLTHPTALLVNMTVQRLVVV